MALKIEKTHPTLNSKEGHMFHLKGGRFTLTLSCSSMSNSNSFFTFDSLGP